MTLVEGIGYFSAALGIAMIAMKTMIPLRIMGLAHNIGQIVFGLLAGVYPPSYSTVSCCRSTPTGCSR